MSNLMKDSFSNAGNSQKYIACFFQEFFGKNLVKFVIEFNLNTLHIALAKPEILYTFGILKNMLLGSFQCLGFDIECYLR